MGFSKMIFGFFFVFFDFNLGKINILPNLIGYILLYLAVSQVIKRMDNKYFLNIRKVSVLLIFLSALEMMIKYSAVLNGVIDNPATIQGRVFSFLFNSTILSLFVYLFYNLAKGIEWEAEKLEAQTLVTKAQVVYKLVLISQILAGFFLLSGLIFHNQQSLTFSTGGGLAIGIIIVVLIAYIYVFVQVSQLLKQAETTFSGSFPVEE